MYYQFFNNIEVDNKCVFIVKSYDCPAQNFWLPPHIQKIGDDYLHNNRKAIQKRRTVKIEAEFLVGEIIFTNEDTLTLTAYSHFNPNASLSPPEVFEKMFGRTFVNGWHLNLAGIMGVKSKAGFKGSAYENVIKNFN